MSVSRDQQPPSTIPGARVPERVSTLELFFDLVFVFTITQVSSVIVQTPTLAGVARAALQLGVIFWMYDGYAWMTNAAGPDTWQRTGLMLVGMAGFFVCALAVPRAFDEAGVVFGVGYLVIVVVHLVAFTLRPGATPMASIYAIARGNLISAALVLAAGWMRGIADWILWSTALLLEITTPIITRRIQAFEFNAAHFAERHGCMLLIVFGESLVSVGLSAQAQPLERPVILGALAGLAVTAAMWWSYFVGESTRAACAFAAASQRTRVKHVLAGYELATAVMIAGVIGVAAGTRLRVERLLVPTPPFEAWLVGGGTMVFLLGAAGFRLALGFGSPWPRALGGILALIAVPACIYGSADLGLAVAALAIAATLVIEHAVERGTLDRTGSASMPVDGAPCGDGS